jgi:hypothetical protein
VTPENVRALIDYLPVVVAMIVMGIVGWKNS